VGARVGLSEISTANVGARVGPSEISGLNVGARVGLNVGANESGVAETAAAAVARTNKNKTLIFYKLCGYFLLHTRRHRKGFLHGRGHIFRLKHLRRHTSGALVVGLFVTSVETSTS
jgi:hypothetical protein